MDDDTWTSACTGPSSHARAEVVLPASRRRAWSAPTVAATGPPADHCAHPAGSPGPVVKRSSVIIVARAPSAGPTRRLSKPTASAPAPAGRANPTVPLPGTDASDAVTAAVGLLVHLPSGPRYWFVSPRKRNAWTLLPSARTVTVTHLLL